MLGTFLLINIKVYKLVAGPAGGVRNRRQWMVVDDGGTVEGDTRGGLTIQRRPETMTSFTTGPLWLAGFDTTSIVKVEPSGMDCGMLLYAKTSCVFFRFPARSVQRKLQRKSSTLPRDSTLAIRSLVGRSPPARCIPWPPSRKYVPWRRGLNPLGPKAILTSTLSAAPPEFAISSKTSFLRLSSTESSIEIVRLGWLAISERRAALSSFRTLILERSSRRMRAGVTTNSCHRTPRTRTPAESKAPCQRSGHSVELNTALPLVT